jgi:hypothetical protein
MSVEALERLRDALREVELELDLPDAPAARHARTQLVEQVDDYLLPRLRQLDAPLLMVVGGSTGAGKSTLVNSLVGRQVSPAGVLRPTTRTPVLACNPEDLRWFESARVLPELSRTTGGDGGGARGLQLVPTPALAEGVALLDSPDIDSVAHENRALADQLLAAADTWLFVTTAARYADAVPWELLKAARERGTVVAVVLNRVPPDAGEVAGHLRAMLDERGLGETELLVVPESRLEDGLLPAAALAPVRTWLDGLTADAQARSELIARTLSGALASIPRRVGVVATAVAAQGAAVESLRTQVELAYEQAADEIEEALRSGALLRGEVLARWYDVVGTGEFMRALESKVSWARDRLRSFLSAKPSATDAVTEAVETGVESVVLAAAARAAERVADGWRQLPAGRALVAGGELDTVAGGLAEATAREVRDWQGDVFELVRNEGMGRRTTARLASLGVNGAGLTVMLAVFLQTGGLTGAEIVIAGGTSAIGQKVLEAIFGDQAVRELAAKARENLLERVRRLLDGEARRFTERLEPLAPEPGAAERLRELAADAGA